MKEQQVTLVAVDDDPTTLELIKEALQGLEGIDLQIHTTTDPDEALELILEKQADIAVLDLVLPGRDGMELLETIVQKSPGTEVILLTGHYSTDSALEAIQSRNNTARKPVIRCVTLNPSASSAYDIITIAGE